LLKIGLNILNLKSNTSYYVFAFMFISFISLSFILLFSEKIRNNKKNGWITIEAKKDIDVENDFLNEIKNTPLITDL